MIFQIAISLFVAFLVIVIACLVWFNCNVVKIFKQMTKGGTDFLALEKTLVVLKAEVKEISDRLQKYSYLSSRLDNLKTQVEELANSVDLDYFKNLLKDLEKQLDLKMKKILESNNKSLSMRIYDLELKSKKESVSFNRSFVEFDENTFLRKVESNFENRVREAFRVMDANFEEKRRSLIYSVEGLQFKVSEITSLINDVKLDTENLKLKVSDVQKRNLQNNDVVVTFSKPSPELDELPILHEKLERMEKKYELLCKTVNDIKSQKQELSSEVVESLLPKVDDLYVLHKNLEDQITKFLPQSISPATEEKEVTVTKEVESVILAPTPKVHSEKDREFLKNIEELFKNVKYHVQKGYGEDYLMKQFIQKYGAEYNGVKIKEAYKKWQSGKKDLSAIFFSSDFDKDDDFFDMEYKFGSNVYDEDPTKDFKETPVVNKFDDPLD